MKAWLVCGVPTPGLLDAQRRLEAPRPRSLRYVIQLFCQRGFPGSEQLPQGPPRGHGVTVDIDALRYDSWQRPSQRR